MVQWATWDCTPGAILCAKCGTPRTGGTHFCEQPSPVVNPTTNMARDVLKRRASGSFMMVHPRCTPNSPSSDSSGVPDSPGSVRNAVLVLAASCHNSPARADIALVAGVCVIVPEWLRDLYADGDVVQVVRWHCSGFWLPLHNGRTQLARFANILCGASACWAGRGPLHARPGALGAGDAADAGGGVG